MKCSFRLLYQIGDGFSWSWTQNHGRDPVPEQRHGHKWGGSGQYVERHRTCSYWGRCQCSTGEEAERQCQVRVARLTLSVFLFHVYNDWILLEGQSISKTWQVVWTSAKWFSQPFSRNLWMYVFYFWIFSNFTVYNILISSFPISNVKFQVFNFQFLAFQFFHFKFSN